VPEASDTRGARLRTLAEKGYARREAEDLRSVERPAVWAAANVEMSFRLGTAKTP
jgi:hypothetical protein